MKRIINIMVSLMVCLFIVHQTAYASSHREAPLISYDPLADNTDLYAFRSQCDTNNVVIIANYIPFEHPAGGPNYYTFGSDVLYEIHIDNNPATTGDDIIYRFTFRQENEDPTTFFNIRLGLQNLKTMYRVDRSMDGGATFETLLSNGVVPPNYIGPRSIANPTVGLGVPNYNTLINDAIQTLSSGEKIFCGPADDPFFADLGGIFDVGNFRPVGRDGLAKFNCHSIVLEVPISLLQKDGKTTESATSILDPDFIIGVYASASRRQITTFDTATATQSGSGNWVQVSRLGMPLTNEVIISIGSKNKWNASAPANDVQFSSYYENPELALYMDDSQFGGAVPGLSQLRIQTNSLGTYDFRNGQPGLYPLKGTPAVEGTALDDDLFGDLLLPDDHSPRAVDILPIFLTGVPNLPPYQLATGKDGDPLAPGKPFVNNFLPTVADMLRLNMAVPVTRRSSEDFSSLGLVQAAVLGLTDPRFDSTTDLEFIPNMDGFPNGRRLEDDVTTIELQAVSGVVLAAIGLWYDDYDGTGSPVTPDFLNVYTFTAGVTQNDTTFKGCYPYIQAPWKGFVGDSYRGPDSTTLPVTWLGFTVSAINQKALLQWQVTNQINNDHFEVEYSTDATHYSKIAQVSSNNSGNYEYLHVNPSLNKTNFYRIKQVDKDGRFVYSAVRFVKFAGGNIITITPNPATSIVNVNSSQSTLNITVYNSSGKKVLSQKLTNGFAQINVASLAKGVYFVVADANGIKVDSKRLLKQ